MNNCNKTYQSPLHQGLSLIFLIILSCCIFISSHCLADANEDAEPLLQKLKTANNQQKANLYNQLANIYLSRSTKASLAYATMAQSIAEQHHFYNALAVSQLRIAQNYHTTGQYSKALKLVQQCINVANQQSLQTILAQCLTQKGLTFSLQGNPADALENMLAALRISKSHNDVETQSLILNQLAQLYTEQNQLDIALSYINQAIEMSAKSNNIYQESMIFSSLSRVLMQQNNIDDALEISLNKLTKYQQQTPNILAELNMLTNVAEIYLLKDSYQQANQYIKRSLELLQNIDNEAIYLSSLNLQAKILIAEGKNEQAIAHIQQSLIKAKLSNHRPIIRSLYLNLSQAMEKAQQYQDAFIALQQYSELSENIQSRTNLRKLNDAKIRMDIAYKEQEQEILKRDNAILSLELEEKQQELYLLLLGLVAFVIIAFLLVRQYQLKQKTHSQMIQKHEHLEANKSQLEELTRTDHLTGLFNRRAMYELLNHEIDRVSRNNTPFTIILVDIDDFKAVNDQFGHNVGDIVIQHVAELIGNAIREQDHLARWGGEEFLMLLPETPLQGAQHICEKLLQKVRSSTFKFSDHELSLTVTMGFAEYHNKITLDQCIKMADKALYEGKTSGKDQAVPFLQTLISL